MRFFIASLTLVFSCFARAGGPTCAPGYCMNSNGSGCHPCGHRLLDLIVAKPAEVLTTPTGIPLDADWKRKVYSFAQKNVVHPAWGLAHSERNYQVAKSLAQKEGIQIDEDVLLAASFLHDLGGIGSFAKPGVDHAERSVEIIEPLLTAWGFPMGKWPQVKAMILGHVYYGAKPDSPAVMVFRDADILDFLGSVGVARIMAVTLEDGFSDGTLKPTVGTLKGFAGTLAEKCSLSACRDMAAPRVKEMQEFLSSLNQETFQENAL